MSRWARAERTRRRPCTAPVENRIDELYLIVQYLDPEILGPLFRFNREFYRLDERGRPVDYQNLAELRRRVQPLMLRRRKAEVEKELPGRTVKNYFVSMAEEQRLRYEDYHAPAARLIALAQKRPLTQAEFERLQMLLSCMRMVCDTPAILDPSCRISPKLEESLWLQLQPALPMAVIGILALMQRGQADPDCLHHADSDETVRPP
jgi:SNF2 family DNA or RNA helicase